MKTKFTPVKHAIFQIVFASISLLFSLSANSQNIQGTVFEDKNYGGGAGRSLLASSGSVIPNAVVELYDGGGNFLQATATDAGGGYTFTGLATGTYKVRVVNNTVSSVRAGYITSLIPVQTFITEAVIAGIAIPVQNKVGGEIPAEQDAPVNTTSLTLNTLSSIAGQEVQSVATVAVTNSVSTTAIDFGFCFDVIVNTNDAGQGSYRQFVINASNLGGEASLVQNGNTWNALSTINAVKPLPAGKENSIFMISDGGVHPGLRAGLTNLLSVNGVAIITTSTTLYPLLAYSAAPNPDNTSLDAGTQTANVGNTNNTILGTGGNAGIGPDAIPNSGDEFVLCQINGPEVEINGNASQYPLQIFANNVAIRCISMHSSAADIHVMGGNNNLIEQCVIGATAISFTPPAVRGGGSRALIYFDLGSVSATVQNNLIGFSSQEEMRFRFWNTPNINYTVLNNEIAGGLPGTPGPGPGIATNDNYTPSPNSASAKGSLYIKGNLIRDCGPTGISSGVHYNLANANQFLTTVEENTLIRNSAGFQALFGSGNDIIVHNLIKDNRNMGVRVANRSADPAVVTAGVKISQNSIYNNGTTAGGTSGLGIDLNEDYVTANAGAYNNAIPNLSINYPIINLASLSGNTLTVNGFVGSAVNQSAFGNTRIEFFKANSSDNNQAGEKIAGDLLSVQHGEGEIYLGFALADANGNFSISFSTTLISSGDAITATATDNSNNTSEFSPEVLIPTGGPLPVKYFSFDAVVSDNVVSLKWVTEQEADNNYFEVERSFDGNVFTLIGTVRDGFITGNKKSYQLIDNAAELKSKTVAYYRLKQTDNNGKVNYTNRIAVKLQLQKNDVAIQTSPNPFIENLNVSFSAAEKGIAEIIILNSNGQKIIFKQTTISKGYNSLQVNGLNNLSFGMYIAQVKINGVLVGVQKVIKN
jgi:trimeric autotransporter adhesin